MNEPYPDLPGLSPYYLEESYVLGISAEPGKVVFRVDLVLTPAHHEYRPPGPQEQYCYRKGQITFSGVTRLLWTRQGARPGSDASGELDYGQIDSITFASGRYSLEGTWGRMEIDAQTVSVTLDPAS